MDWLEELWEKLKNRIKNTGLMRGMFFYLFMAICSSGVLYFLTRNVCESWIHVIQERYPDNWYYNDVKIAIAQFLYYYGFVVYIVIALGAAVLMYFQNRIYPALETVKAELENLAVGDYSFEMSYSSQDEIGLVCREAEQLRQQLIQVQKESWESQEDQRSINAAFAHDLRTPLTVMKGYTEFLLKYIPQGKVKEEVLLEKLRTLQAQQERMIAFTRTMSDIQKIEQRDVSGEWQALKNLYYHLKETAQTLTAERGITCQVTAENDLEGEIFADAGIILEVYDNLLHNALRYAKSRIEVRLQLEDRRLLLFVRDDGKGFTEKALRTGSKVYYSEAKEEGEHFGLGLFICKTLCEKHGGGLTLINSVDGGAIAMAEFFCRRR